MNQISVDRIARETDEAKIEKQREALSAQLTTMDELLPVSSTTTTRPTPRRTRWWCTAAYAVDEDARALYELGVIVVRDARHLTARLDDEKREDVEDETQEQLAFADIVLLNKIDIVPEEAELQKIEARIREVNPNTQILRSQHSVVDGKRLLCVGAIDVQRVLEFVPELLTNLDEHKHDETVTSVSVNYEGELLAKAEQDWIGRLVALQGADLFRYKGACEGIKRSWWRNPSSAATSTTCATTSTTRSRWRAPSCSASWTAATRTRRASRTSSQSPPASANHTQCLLLLPDLHRGKDRAVNVLKLDEVWQVSIGASALI